MKFDVKCPNGCGGYLTKGLEGDAVQRLYCRKCDTEWAVTVSESCLSILPSWLAPSLNTYVTKTEIRVLT